ncbi:MAG: rhodanese-like domain-containing protein [Chloroflexota bacterium]|jgi:rhodanese-related sulfurtransferase
MSKNQSQPAKNTRFSPGTSILLLLILAAAVFSVLSNTTGQAVAFPSTIGVAEAAELREQGAFILDVRQPEEWNEVHVPGATLIPLGQLSARISEVPTDREIVVICRSGNRSQTARDILRQAGYENVTSVSGGIIAWQAAGLPTASAP